MVVEGVTFVEDEAKKMKKREFVEKHKFLFGDRTEIEAENLLSNIYDKIVSAKTPSEGII